MNRVGVFSITQKLSGTPVSYTHLDVYKRQEREREREREREGVQTQMC